MNFSSAVMTLALRDGQPAVLTSEWLIADNEPMRPVASYKCQNSVEKMQAMPSIKSHRKDARW